MFFFILGELFLLTELCGPLIPIYQYKHFLFKSILTKSQSMCDCTFEITFQK